MTESTQPQRRDTVPVRVPVRAPRFAARRSVRAGDEHQHVLTRELHCKHLQQHACRSATIIAITSGAAKYIGSVVAARVTGTMAAAQLLLACLFALAGGSVGAPSSDAVASLAAAAGGSPSRALPQPCLTPTTCEVPLVAPLAPLFAATWRMNESSIVMPCNGGASAGGWSNATFFGSFGVADARPTGTKALSRLNLRGAHS